MMMRERMAWAAYNCITARCKALVPNALVKPDAPRDDTAIDCRDIVDVVLGGLAAESFGMSGGIIQAGIDANEIPPSGSVVDIFRAMVRAVKEGQ